MEDALRAGVAVYNDGRYHAAHDAWEDRWLDVESGTDDERFLHGLIQFTAAVHHASGRNWSGATGLAESAGEYLSGLPGTYRGVNLVEVQAYLRRLGDDPEVIERRRPLALTHCGQRLRLADLDAPAALAAAPVLAESDGRFDERVLARAAEFAREELGGSRARFTALVYDFVRGDADRGLVYRRLRAHVDRRERKEDDVAGLFD